MKLSKSEEQLMQHLWELDRAFLQDLIEKYPEPKPAPSTVATLLKRMNEKGYVDYEQRGRSREYYPLIPKRDYFSRKFNELIGTFFNDSATQFASFFASKSDLSTADLQELKAIIEEEIEKKNK